MQEVNLLIIEIKEDPIRIKYETHEFRVVAVARCPHIRNICDEGTYSGEVSDKIASGFLAEPSLDGYAYGLHLSVKRWRDDHPSHASLELPLFAF